MFIAVYGHLEVVFLAKMIESYLIQVHIFCKSNQKFIIPLFPGIREIIFGKRTAEYPLPKSLNGKFDSLPPVEGLIFEFVFDFKARGQWKHWNDIIKNMEIEDLYNYQDVLVPTIDSSRYCHILGKIYR